MPTTFEAIRDREVRERRRAALYAALLLVAAAFVFGAIVWAYR